LTEHDNFYGGKFIPDKIKSHIAVHLRHLQIDQTDIRAAAAEHLQRLVTRVRQAHLVAGALQHDLHEAEVVLDVVDDEDATLHLRPFLDSTRPRGATRRQKADPALDTHGSNRAFQPYDSAKIRRLHVTSLMRWSTKQRPAPRSGEPGWMSHSSVNFFRIHHPKELTLAKPAQCHVLPTQYPKSFQSAPRAGRAATPADTNAGVMAKQHAEMRAETRSTGPLRARRTLPRRTKPFSFHASRRGNGPGGPAGLQNRVVPLARDGGFDSLLLPPSRHLMAPRRIPSPHLGALTSPPL